MSPVGAGNRCYLHEYAESSDYSCMAEDRVEYLGACGAQSVWSLEESRLGLNMLWCLSGTSWMMVIVIDGCRSSLFKRLR